jgi:hypothetical protein
MAEAPIRYSMNLVFEASAQMSLSHVRRAVVAAIADEVRRSEPDDGFATVQRDTITVLRISAVATNAVAKPKGAPT